MANKSNVISHWYQLVESFQVAPLSFYGGVESAIQSRQVPELQQSRTEFKEGGLLTAHREYLHIQRGRYVFDICAAPFGTGFFVSWWLTELRSKYGWFFLLGFIVATDIAAIILYGIGTALFGFISAFLFTFIGLAVLIWAFGHGVREGLIDAEDILLATPLLGTLYERVFNPPTFYKTDTALMFQQAVHNAVLEVIDGMLAAKGLRALSDGERKPILSAFAKSA